VVVKKEARSTAPPVKDAKADSSFFSAPKPKAKLPTFKKAAVVIKKEDTAAILSSNVSQPSNFDPFQEALKSMKVAKRDSPAVSTPPPQSASSTDTADAQYFGTTLKKRKSVTWAPDGQLESIKLIERAVYDDDPTDVRFFQLIHIAVLLMQTFVLFR
jgi:protein phosphatase 1 regulatory subunit 10